MTTATLLERAANTSRLRVDRERGIIRGVKILGLESKNGRSYESAALKAAVGLYEGAKVNLNHPDRTNLTRDRMVEERIGVMRNVTFREGQGLFADFFFNPKHALAEQIAWDAENDGSIGFSHNAECREAKKRVNGRAIIEAIIRVRSVDLVADPATSDGFFESVGLGHLSVGQYSEPEVNVSRAASTAARYRS